VVEVCGVGDARRPTPSGPVVAAKHLIPLAFTLLFSSFVIAAEPRPPLQGGVEKSDRGQGKGYCERYGARIEPFEGQSGPIPVDEIHIRYIQNVLHLSGVLGCFTGNDPLTFQTLAMRDWLVRFDGRLNGGPPWSFEPGGSAGITADPSITSQKIPNWK
jgi:hypothetical protein